MPMHESFKKILDNMIKQYGEKNGEKVFWGFINKNKYDETKPFPVDRAMTDIMTDGLNDTVGLEG